MRLPGFDLGAATADENSIRHFRNRLTEPGILKRVMKGNQSAEAVQAGSECQGMSSSI